MKIISRAEARAAGQEFYFTGEPCKHGHVELRRVSSCKCLQCVKEEGTSRHFANRDASLAYKKRRYRENREEQLAAQAEYRARNKEAIAERNKTYREANAERVSDGKRRCYERKKDQYLAKQKQRYEENREEILRKQREYSKKHKARTREYNARYRQENREYINQYFRDRRAKDPLFALKGQMRSMLKRCLGAGSASFDSKTSEMLGYTAQELRDHVERQFTKGMGWHNRSDWHIDHITPIAWFFERGTTDPAQINCLSNLRPTWASENLSKGSDMEYLL